MMQMPGMFFKFFWIFPIAGMGIFLLLLFLVVRRVLGPARRSSLPKQEQQPLSGRKFSGKIPEELKEAGVRVLENLDWEIRFLEKQRIEAQTPEERQNIEAKLTRKREEYQATVDRLEP